MHRFSQTSIFWLLHHSLRLDCVTTNAPYCTDLGEWRWYNFYEDRNSYESVSYIIFSESNYHIPHTNESKYHLYLFYDYDVLVNVFRFNNFVKSFEKLLSKIRRVLAAVLFFQFYYLFNFLTTLLSTLRSKHWFFLPTIANFVSLTLYEHAKWKFFVKNCLRRKYEYLYDNS